MLTHLTDEELAALRERIEPKARAYERTAFQRVQESLTHAVENGLTAGDVGSQKVAFHLLKAGAPISLNEIIQVDAIDAWNEALRLRGELFEVEAEIRRRG